MKSSDHDDLSKYQTEMVEKIKTTVQLFYTSPANCNCDCAYGDAINVCRRESILLENGL